MPDPRKKKKFLNLPSYTGGKKAFSAFLQQNIKYPQKALDEGVEGNVIVEFEIDDNGFVHNPRVMKGIGSGCDEEAIRVVSLLRYEKVKNQGLRVKSTTKTNIHFKLPARITYNVTVVSSKKDPIPDKAPPKAENTYGYTITF
jgi:TonB family protein